MNHPSNRFSDPPDSGSGFGSPDPALERLLQAWSDSHRPDPTLVDRVFAASRREIARRAGSEPSLAGRISEWLAVFSPPRLALAAAVLVALGLPAVVLVDRVDDPTRGDTSTGVGLAEAPLVPPVLEAPAPVAEPILVAMLEPASADWRDLLDDEHGVELFSVIEARGSGIEDYDAEFEAIFGSLESNSVGM